jgi:hypothetical protein
LAREAVLLVRCDVCRDRDGRQESAQHEGVIVRISGQRADRTLDLCDRHYQELLQFFAHGRVFRADRPRTARQPRRGRDRNPGRQVGPFRCLVDGCVASPLKHRGTLWQHLRAQHGMTLDEYQERYGELVPLTAEEKAQLVVEVRCEVDGCDQVYSTALGNRYPQSALTSHMWGRHGIKL